MNEPILAAPRLSIAKTARARDKPAKPYEVWADTPKGLLLRVQPSGVRTYYVQLGRGKRCKVGRAGTYTLGQAEEIAKKLLLDPIAATTKVRTTNTATLSKYITEHYLSYAVARLKNGEQSAARVTAKWGALLHLQIADIRIAAVEAIRDQRLNDGIAASTVNRDVAALSGVLSHWARSNGAKNPLHGLKALPVAEDEAIRYLSPEESARLRQALQSRDANQRVARSSANAWREDRGYATKPAILGYCDHLTPMVLLSLNTGLRQGELFSLTWSAVDMNTRTLSVLASNSKGNRTRTIPLNDEAHDILRAIRPNDANGLVFASPVTGGRLNNVKKAWAGITEAAGIPDLRWHDLRHDFASQLVMLGVSLYVVQELLGNTKAKMTQLYARLAPSTLATAVSRLALNQKRP